MIHSFGLVGARPKLPVFEWNTLTDGGVMFLYGYYPPGRPGQSGEDFMRLKYGVSTKQISSTTLFAF